MNSIVIGSSRAQKIPSLVLEHSVLARTSTPIRIIHTYDKTFPEPESTDLKSKTGFSFNRFAVPDLVGRTGLALYLECDQVVYSDVNELFQLPLGQARVGRPRNQASVLLLDCARLTWNVAEIVRKLDRREYGYADLMERLSVEPKEKIAEIIPDAWNSLEAYDRGRTKLLHYTNMAIQPWRRWGHPLTHLWMAELKGALACGRVSEMEIREDVNLGHIVPQILSGL